MTQPATALVIFVKTPGLSPIKTRLAAGIGRERAEEFYRLSLAAVEATAATVGESHDVCPYWAVAEGAGLAVPLWQQFQRIHQGTGSLGDRLNKIFTELQSRHKVVVAIGADSPQITPSLIREAIERIMSGPSRHRHAIGRCHDGGFYLFGANYGIPNAVWQSVPFGTSTAAVALYGVLQVGHACRELPVRADVDRVEDLEIFCQEFLEIASPTPAQLAVLEWAKRISVSIDKD